MVGLNDALRAHGLDNTGDNSDAKMCALAAAMMAVLYAYKEGKR